MARERKIPSIDLSFLSCCGFINIREKRERVSGVCRHEPPLQDCEPLSAPKEKVHGINQQTDLQFSQSELPCALLPLQAPL